MAWWNPIDYATEIAKEGASKVTGNAYDMRNPASPYYGEKKTVQIPGRAITPSEARDMGISGGGQKQGGGGAPSTQGTGSGYGGYDAAQAAKDAEEAKQRGVLRGDINDTGSLIMEIYKQLFGALDNLLKERAKTTEDDYGEQLGTLTKQYTESIPAIESSYTALGAGDSTDTTYAKNDAQEGFNTGSKTIEKNKKADLAKIGDYGAEMRARWGADRDSVERSVNRAGEVENLGELRDYRNSLEGKLGDVKADKGTLNTDEGARGQLSSLTKDAGRFESVTNALDSIIKSSMSGAVKDAAKQAVIDAGGLDDEEKKKVEAMYGNTYAEQAAL